ncbi:MAG: tRNA lysidine(34) synthetase TilS [Opitutales bacterium]
MNKAQLPDQICRAEVLSVSQTLGLPSKVRPEVTEALSSSGVVAVACSGGVDSVAALLWVWATYPQLTLRVVHFDHRIRGEASAADAAFVEALANCLGIECISDAWLAADPDASESLLRDARLEFFSRIYRSERLESIVTGHHVDDLVETFLMRALRGVGAHGLSAPRPVSRASAGMVFLRPFLDVEKSSLVEFLKQLSIKGCSDETNADTRYLRNAVRKQVTPELESVSQQFGRDLRAMISKTRDTLEADSEILEWAVDAALDKARVPETERLSRAVLRTFPEVLQQRVVESWLRSAVASEGSSGALVEIVAAIAQDEVKEVQISAAWKVRIETSLDAKPVGREKDSVEFEFSPSRLIPGVDIFLPGGRVFRADMCEVGDELMERISSRAVDPKGEAWLALTHLDLGGLYLRNRRPGDRYHLLGAPGSKKLKDILNQRKIPLSERIILPTVCDNAESILWVPGLPPSETVKISESTKLALRLTYRSL